MDILELLHKYESVKKIKEILTPFLEEVKTEIESDILSAKTTEELWKARGELELLTKIMKNIEWKLKKYEKEKEAK